MGHSFRTDGAVVTVLLGARDALACGDVVGFAVTIVVFAVTCFGGGLDFLATGARPLVVFAKLYAQAAGSLASIASFSVEDTALFGCVTRTCVAMFADKGRHIDGLLFYDVGHGFNNLFLWFYAIGGASIMGLFCVRGKLFADLFLSAGADSLPTTLTGGTIHISRTLFANTTFAIRLGCWTVFGSTALHSIGATGHRE